MKKVLVTGAAGFIGARTAKLLLDDGIEVVGFDNLNDAYDTRIKTHRLEELKSTDGFDFIEGDVENLSQLESVFRDHEFDTIFNLAARAGVRYSIENPHVYLRTNAHGTLNLLEMMRKHEVRKFVLASTSSLYAGQPLPFRETLAVDKPLSPYAASKKAAEAMCYTYHHLFQIDVSILRYFTVYGPAGRPDMAPFRFAKWIESGTPLTVFGDGRQSRDFTYVDDIARGTIAAAKPVGYEIINLGGGQEPVTLIDFIRMIEKRIGKSAKIEWQDSHPADMKDTGANIEKAKSLLGWEPEISLAEGLDRMVAWHRDNLDWVTNVDVGG